MAGPREPFVRVQIIQDDVKISSTKSDGPIVAREMSMDVLDQDRFGMPKDALPVHQDWI